MMGYHSGPTVVSIILLIAELLFNSLTKTERRLDTYCIIHFHDINHGAFQFFRYDKNAYVKFTRIQRSSSNNFQNISTQSIVCKKKVFWFEMILMKVTDITWTAINALQATWTGYKNMIPKQLNLHLNKSSKIKAKNNPLERSYYLQPWLNILWIW